MKKLSQSYYIISMKCDPGIANHLKKDKFHPLVRDAMAHANLIIVTESTAEGVLYWDDIN
jgi:hypothetical protein